MFAHGGGMRAQRAAVALGPGAGLPAAGKSHQQQRQQWCAAGDALIAEHRRLWRARCRDGGLDDSCRWYRAAQGEWLPA